MKYTEMSKGEAVTVIIEAAEKWNKIFGARELESMVMELANKWNKANEDDYIDIYPYAWDGFNDGYDCGIGIEDDHVIYHYLEEEWEAYRKSEFL